MWVMKMITMMPMITLKSLLRSITMSTKLSKPFAMINPKVVSKVGLMAAQKVERKDFSALLKAKGALAKVKASLEALLSVLTLLACPK